VRWSAWVPRGMFFLIHSPFTPRGLTAERSRSVAVFAIIAS
jgi:hypothetical protein